MSDDATLTTIEVPEGRLACRIWQPAQPRGTLLLLHGFGGDSLTFGALGPMLATRGWHVVAPDMPAHGASEIEADTPDGVLRPLAGLLAQLPGKLALAGHSLGGAMATRLAAGTDRAVSLTLLAPGGLGREVDAELIRSIAHIETGEQLRALLARVAFTPPPVPMNMLDELAKLLGPRGRLKRLAEALVGTGRQSLEIVADLARLTIPARMLFGLDDSVIPWTQVRAVPPRVAIHLLPRAGHSVHWDQPELVADLIA